MKKKLLVFILLVLFGSTTYGQDFSLDKSENLNYIQGEVIVKYKDSSKTKRDTKSKSISVFDTELDNDNLDIKQKLNNKGDIVLVEINNGNSVEETIDLLKNDPNIEFVEPNFVRYLFSGETSNNITEKDQWALSAISWYDAFNTYSGDLKNAEPIVAGVVDNGVNYNHLDLVNSMWNPSSCSFFYNSLDCVHGFDFFHGKSTPLANSNSHGTHVAGIIAAEANNGIGITGINPYAKIAALKIGDSIQLSSFDELSAIYFAIENGIKLINASFGGTSYSDIEYLAIENFGNAGGLFIAAAGNESGNVDRYPVYPCSYDLDNIICVAATSDVNGSFASDYSNYGTSNVDIAAPGSSIVSSVTSDTLEEFLLEDFNKDKGKCTTGWEVLDDWKLMGTGGCISVSKYNDKDYGYIFVDAVNSPFFSGKNASDLSIYVNCIGGANLSFEYSTGNSNYIPFYQIMDIEGDGMYRISLVDNIDDDIFDNLSLGFKILNKASSIACVIDDIDVYVDPYSSGSVNLYGRKSGTSMATPNVVGLASMAWMLNPDLTNLDVKRLILENGDYKSGLSTKVKNGKVINVKKTLDEAVKIVSPSGLNSDWSGYIQWDNVSRAQSYYYEILSGDTIVDSGNIVGTGVQTGLSGDYVWRVKSIAGTSGSDSNFSTGYLCRRPVLTISNLIGNFSGYECTSLIGDFTFSDNCSNNYEMGRVGGTGKVTLDKSGVVVKQIYIRNSFGEENIWDIDYYFNDAIPTLNSGSYTNNQLLDSSSSIGNALTLFGVIDGVCGASSISVSSISCSEGQGSISGNDIFITPPSNKKGSSSCSVMFKDDEGNEVSGALTYSYDTVQTTTGNGGGGGGGGGSSTTQTTTNGGGGGGGGDSYSCKNLPANATANNKSTPKSNINYSYSTDTSKVCTFQCNSGYTRDEKNGKCVKIWVATGNVDTGDMLQNIDIEKTKQIELFGETDIANNSTSNIDFSWFNESNPSSILSNGFTVEFNNAYEFAHRAGITTIDSIEKANMNGSLTRIAMAKMLSNYAMNILGKVPVNSIVPDFPDVSQKMNDDYGGAVTLSYQLGIMGKGINKFRPNDIVSRAEFGTALSRMLYGTQDGEGNYYSTHLDKLSKEGVISNTNPELKELRGYVMIMLMRSAKK